MSIINEKSLKDIKVAIQNPLSSKTFPYGKNLFNKENITYGKAIIANGELGDASPQWYASGFIPVIPHTKIILRSVPMGATIYNAFYDENKQFIAGSSKTNNSTSTTRIRTVPSNAAYFRFTGGNASEYPNASADNMQVEYGEVTTDYERFNAIPKTPNFIKPQEVIIDKSIKDGLNEIINDVAKPRIYPFGKNLFNEDTITIDRLLGPSGEVLNYPSTNWYVSDFIPVFEGEYIKLSSAFNSNEALSCFYDKDKQPIVSTILDNIELRNQELVRKVPTGAAYFRFSNHLTSIGKPSTMQVEYGMITTEYESFIKVPSNFNFRKPQEVFIKDTVPVKIENNQLGIDGYEVISDKKDYQILINKTGNVIRAIHKNIAVAVNGINVGSTIYISQNGVDGDYNKSVVFNDTNFPNLEISPSTRIREILIIPFTRNLTDRQTGEDFRIFVVVETGQLYHNFPARSTTGDGAALDDDIIKFDESVVWDIKDRRFPSPDPSASGVEKYIPGLPERNYQYRPAILQDNGYGNGGHPKSITHGSITYSRFYEPQKNIFTSFLFMGGFEPTDKVTLLGTYRPNNTVESGSRTCIFATSDGGRSWYNKYEFASYSGHSNGGVLIDSSAERYDPFEKGAYADYIAGSFIVKKIIHTVPTAENKEPSTLFSFGPEAVINSISKAKPTVVTTVSNHSLETHDVIVIQKNNDSSSVSPDWDWLKNDSLDETNGGNGTLFKVEKISDTQFALREYIHSPFNNLSCRHIHSINRIKNGFTFGCGEGYPHGWLFYVPVRQVDTFAVFNAWDNLNVIRLTSTPNAALRTLGFLLLDDADSTIIFASDESYLSRPKMVFPDGRTVSVSNNSMGVFKGKLSDIDDFSKFECIFEGKEMAYFFKEIGNAWIFGGQRGEAGISFDRGKTWSKDNFGKMVQHFRGQSGNMIVIDDVIIILK